MVDYHFTQKTKPNEEVKVQVGVVEADGGKLKRLKGSALPLVVPCTCSTAGFSG